MELVLFSGYAAIMLAFGVVATITLVLMLYAWSTPEELERTAFAAENAVPSGSFSLLVPARHEEAVLGASLDALARSNHPLFEILVIVGHDDPGTHAVADAAAARADGKIRVVVDTHEVKNKPKALNTALELCRGQYVGVFDAEDVVHPDLLRRVSLLFADEGIAVVQGGVQLINHDSSWYALRNVLEYYFWFRSRLHFQAAQRFIPLGGNTVFIRAKLLRSVGGWDEHCLAEDCELGARLSVRGERTVVAYDPEVATREETPGSLVGLMRQRTRWNQGFLQVLHKPYWRQLPLRPRILALYTLGMPFFQAFTGVFVPVALVTMILAKAPVGLSMLTFVPLMPALAVLAAEAAGLREFGREFDRRIRVRDYVRLVVGSLPYQLVLSFAALRALWRHRRGQDNWEKTEHAGTHLHAAVPGSAPAS